MSFDDASNQGSAVAEKTAAACCVDVALAAVGIGCHSFVFLLGPAATVFLAQCTPDVPHALLLCALCYVCAAVSTRLTRDWRQGASGQRTLLVGALAGVLLGAGGMAFSGIALPAGPLTTTISLVCAALLGASLGLTNRHQVEMLQAVRARCGQRAQLLAIVGGGLTTSAMMLLSACCLRPDGALLLLVGGAVLSTVLGWRSVGCFEASSPAPLSVGEEPPSSARRLLVESAARGLACSTALALMLFAGFGATGGARLSVAAALGGLTVPCALLLLMAHGRTRESDGTVYGTNLRVFVVVLGIVAALFPLLKGHPALLCCACWGLLQFNSSLAMFNVANLCHSQGASARNTVPTMYAVTAVSSCVGFALVAGVRACAGETTCYEVAAFLGVASALAFVPMLPAKRSPINVMVLSAFPEEESPADRAARVREQLVAGHVLTAREGEVFELLLEGRTRKEIADRLDVSASTVKNHATSVYEKLGVHSQRELVERVLHGGEGQRVER